jgi:hypothetical protein
MRGVKGNVSAARQADMDWARFIRPPSFLNELFRDELPFERGSECEALVFACQLGCIPNAVGIQTLC